MFHKFERSNAMSFLLMTLLLAGLTWVQLKDGDAGPPLHLFVLGLGCGVGLLLVGMIAVAKWMRPRVVSQDDGWQPGQGPVIDGEVVREEPPKERDTL